MTDELLPALPEPSLMTHLGNVGFTADQLRAYAREAIRQQWRPISEAPKGAVLLYWPATGVTRGHRGPTLSEMMRIGMVGETPNRLPTHWMPLPSPPAGEVA